MRRLTPSGIEHLRKEPHRKQLRLPTIHIHPDDAASRHIATGDTVRVLNKRGSIELLAKVVRSVRRGVVSSDKGRWHKHTKSRRFVVKGARKEFSDTLLKARQALDSLKQGKPWTP